MSVPGWWAFVLLALAGFRTWRLLAEDTISERLRRRVGREHFVGCPWCAGFWVTLAWWAAWQAWPYGTLVAAAPFALSALVGLIAANIDPV